MAEARHRVRVLETEKAGIMRAMEHLAQRFSHTFTQSVVRPSIQKVAQGHVYLRWRLLGHRGHQPYIDLASASGRSLLLTLSGDMQPLLVQYGREAMALNLAHSVRQSEWVRLRQFVSDSESLLSFRDR